MHKLSVCHLPEGPAGLEVQVGQGTKDLLFKDFCYRARCSKFVLKAADDMLYSPVSQVLRAFWARQAPPVSLSTVV